MKEYFEVYQEGTCKLRRSRDGTLIDAEYLMGGVYTGKQRVFEGYQVAVLLGSDPWIGRDNHSLRAALRKVASQCESAGFRLSVAGVADGYSESGLSSNTGFGYIQGERVHMMTERIEGQEPYLPGGDE